MADEAEKPTETVPPAPVMADVPVEAPVAEGAVAQPAPVIEAVVPAEEPAPVAPPKAKRKPPVAAVKAEPAPAVSPAPVTARSEPVAGATAAKPEPIPAKARVAKPRAAKPVRIPAASPAKQTRKSVSKPKTVIPTRTRAAAKPAIAQIKEPFNMAKTTPTDFLASFQTAFGEFQTKAAAAYEKSTTALGEANDFAKGNVEAVVESGKILASGLQDLGTSFVADSRSAFDTMTAEVKELAAVKTPAEFFSLQGTLARKNFDSAVSQVSKSTEAMLKLANEVLTPLSGRVTLAVEKVSKVA